MPDLEDEDSPAASTPPPEVNVARILSEKLGAKLTSIVAGYLPNDEASPILEHLPDTAPLPEVNVACVLSNNLGAQLPSLVAEYLPDDEVDRLLLTPLPGTESEVQASLDAVTQNQDLSLAVLWGAHKKRVKRIADEQKFEKDILSNETSRWRRMLRLKYGISPGAAIKEFALAKDELSLSLALQEIEKEILADIDMFAGIPDNRTLNRTQPANGLIFTGGRIPSVFEKMFLHPDEILLVHILKEKNLEAFIEFIHNRPYDEKLTRLKSLFKIFIAPPVPPAPMPELPNDAFLKLMNLLESFYLYDEQNRLQILEWMQSKKTYEKLRRDLNFSQWHSLQKLILHQLKKHLPSTGSLITPIKEAVKEKKISSKYFIFRLMHYMKKPFLMMLALWCAVAALIVILSLTGLVAPVIYSIPSILDTIFDATFWGSLILGISSWIRAVTFDRYITVEAICHTQLKYLTELQQTPNLSPTEKLRYQEIKVEYLRLLRDAFEHQKDIYNNNRLLCFLFHLYKPLFIFPVLTEVIELTLIILGIMTFGVPSPISVALSIGSLLISCGWALYKTYELWRDARLAQAALGTEQDEITPLRLAAQRAPAPENPHARIQNRSVRQFRQLDQKFDSDEERQKKLQDAKKAGEDTLNRISQIHNPQLRELLMYSPGNAQLDIKDEDIRILNEVGRVRLKTELERRLPRIGIPFATVPIEVMRSAINAQGSLFWKPKDQDIAPESMQAEEKEQFIHKKKQQKAASEARRAGHTVLPDEKPAAKKEAQVRDYLLPSVMWKPTWNSLPLRAARRIISRVQVVRRIRTWRINNPKRSEDGCYPRPGFNNQGRLITPLTPEQQKKRKGISDILLKLAAVTRGARQLLQKIEAVRLKIVAIGNEQFEAELEQIKKEYWILNGKLKTVLNVKDEQGNIHSNNYAPFEYSALVDLLEDAKKKINEIIAKIPGSTPFDPENPDVAITPAEVYAFSMRL